MTKAGNISATITNVFTSKGKPAVEQGGKEGGMFGVETSLGSRNMEGPYDQASIYTLGFLGASETRSCAAGQGAGMCWGCAWVINT